MIEFGETTLYADVDYKVSSVLLRIDKRNGELVYDTMWGLKRLKSNYFLFVSLNGDTE